MISGYRKVFGMIALLLGLAGGIGGLLSLVEYVWNEAAAWALLVAAILAWGAVDYFQMSTAFDEDDEMITHVTSEGETNDPGGQAEDDR